MRICRIPLTPSRIVVAPLIVLSMLQGEPARAQTLPAATLSATGGDHPNFEHRTFMRRTLSPAVVTAAAFSSVGSTQAGVYQAGAAPGALCRKAIEQAGKVIKVPGHLLAAIGRVESGRWDAQSGTWQPWPWTINAEGADSFFDTKAQAVAAVRALQARGVVSIDVGCMQVNLMYHPNAFATLDQAFDPPSNALYAARFLTQLFAQTNDWTLAAGFYHSATPDLGADYRRRVLAVWPEEKQAEEARLQAEKDRNDLAGAWAATLAGKPRVMQASASPASALSESLPVAFPASTSPASTSPPLTSSPSTSSPSTSRMRRQPFNGSLLATAGAKGARLSLATYHGAAAPNLIRLHASDLHASDLHASD